MKAERGGGRVKFETFVFPLCSKCEISIVYSEKFEGVFKLEGKKRIVQIKVKKKCYNVSTLCRVFW